MVYSDPMLFSIICMMGMSPPPFQSGGGRCGETATIYSTEAQEISTTQNRIQPLAPMEMQTSPFLAPTGMSTSPYMSQIFLEITGTYSEKEREPDDIGGWSKMALTENRRAIVPYENSKRICFTAFKESRTYIRCPIICSPLDGSNDKCQKAILRLVHKAHRGFGHAPAKTFLERIRASKTSDLVSMALMHTNGPTYTTAITLTQSLIFFWSISTL